MARDILEGVSMASLFDLAKAHYASGKGGRTETGSRAMIAARRMIIRAAATALALPIRESQLVASDPKARALEASMVHVWQRDGIPDAVQAIAKAWYIKDWRLDWIEPYVFTHHKENSK